MTERFSTTIDLNKLFESTVKTCGFMQVEFQRKRVSFKKRARVVHDFLMTVVWPAVYVHLRRTF